MKTGWAPTDRAEHSIAGINLARLIQTSTCDEKDISYCLLASSMILVGEMSMGIVVACIPTLGPILNPSRFSPSSKGNYQYRDRRLTSSKKKLSGQTGDQVSASDISDERPFRVLEDSGIELDDASNIGHDRVPNQHEDHIEANKIRVVKDFYISSSQKPESLH